MKPGKSGTSGLVLLFSVVLQLSAIPLLRAQQSLPTVIYEQTFHGSEPEHYVISITSDCRGTYQSDEKLTDSTADSFHFDFAVTPLSCSKIFDLTKGARYFDGRIDSKRKNIASTGIKTLSYKDSQKNTKATYNYSPIIEVQELTAIFQSLGATMEFGRRLEYDHHYQKLALDEDLERMEASSATSVLQQLSSIAPILQRIVDDPSLMNVVRMRAQRLLAGAK